MLHALDSPPTELFWSAPLASDSDFTVEDPLALDYLGQQVGLWLFRGFTTRRNRAQNYAVVLYGLHLAELALRKYGYGGDDETRTRLFERWERFWALATLEARQGERRREEEERSGPGSRPRASATVARPELGALRPRQPGELVHEGASGDVL